MSVCSIQLLISRQWSLTIMTMIIIIIIITRSSADADNRLDAFSGQSRSIFLRYSMSKNVVTLKLGSEVTQGH